MEPDKDGAYRQLRQISKELLPNSLFLILFFRHIHGYTPNIFRPRTFNEKVLYKMLFDRRPVLKVFADKYMVRSYVKERLGTDKNLPKIYGVYGNADALFLSKLPDEFILKPNHGSGWYKIYRKNTPKDISEIRKLASFWLSQDYHRISREWCYKGIRRLVLVEELLLKDGEPANDFKFVCVNGKPMFIDVNQSRFDNHSCAIYDAEWKPIEGRWGPYQTVNQIIPRPFLFNEMRRIAEILSAQTDLLRVDLYDTDQGVYVGELTNYPSAGRDLFEPAELDKQFGQQWTLPKRYTDDMVNTVSSWTVTQS